MSNLDDVLQPFNNLGANLTPTNNLNGLINAGASLNGNLLLGGSGTDNYNDLTNKPQINGVTLQGNKGASDLGLFSGNYNDLTNRPSIPSKLNDLDVTYYNLQDGDTLRYIGEPVNGWENAPFPNSLSSLNDVDVTSPVGGHALIFDSQSQKWVDRPYPYYNLTSKPTLNNVTISGNKTSLDYGLFSGNYNDLTNKPSLANVATSGDYDDLINTPTIPTVPNRYSFLLSFGMVTAAQYITSTTFVQVANSYQYNITQPGGYMFVLLVNAEWSQGAYQFYAGLDIDGNTRQAENSFAIAQGNATVIFVGTCNFDTPGTKEFKFMSRVSHADKNVKIEPYTTLLGILIKL